MRFLTQLVIGLSMVFLVACGEAEVTDENPEPDTAETISTGQDDPTATPTQTADDGMITATMTGEIIAPSLTGEPEATDMTSEFLMEASFTYWDDDDDNRQEIELGFSPERINGFIGDTTYRMNFLSVRVALNVDETMTLTLPEDNDLIDPDYSMGNPDYSVSYAPVSWDDVTGSVTATVDQDGNLSGDVSVTMPLFDSENNEPAGEITLDIPFEDIPLDNVERYVESIEGIQHDAELRQAMVDAVTLDVSGALELSVESAETLYHRPSRSVFLLRTSVPDVALIEIGIDDGVAPGTYTPEGLCADYIWDDTCFTFVAFDEDGNYTEYTENITGDLVIESVIPLTGTIDLTAEDMAGNTITITGDLSDVPFPLEDNL